MAGSRKWYRYESDANVGYSMEMDVDHADFIGNAALTGGEVPCPRTIEKRYALYRNKSGTSSRKIWLSTNAMVLGTIPDVLTVTAANGEPTSDTDDNTYILSFMSGEKQRVITTEDTGMTEGAAP